MPFPLRGTLALIFCAAALSSSCIRRQFNSLPPMYINLYSGIADVAYLGEHESQVLGRKWQFKEVAVSSDASAKNLGVEKIVELPEIGVKLYFKRQLVTLIEIRTRSLVTCSVAMIRYSVSHWPNRIRGERI
ncbi:MAG: hypothetical protein R3B54_11690 [Bdellovibrionota bacterium]